MSTRHKPPDPARQPPFNLEARKAEYERRLGLERDFYSAIARGDLREIRRLKGAGYARHLSRTTPLHAAVATDRVETIALLLELGERIDDGDSYGDTPLSAAVLGGHLQALDYLLQRGADPHAVGANLMSGSMPEPGTPLLQSIVYSGDEWLTREPARVPALSAGLALLFDRKPELLPEWKANLHLIMVRIRHNPGGDQQWRSLVAAALRERGREDLVASITLPVFPHSL